MVDDLNQGIEDAIGILRGGGVLGLPTETVYGLGADAENAQAVARIFALKGRPANHPLIVHLADAAQLTDWAREIPDVAWKLAERFWPGPLTLVLKRGAKEISAATGGHPTVALRVPAHPLALAVLRGFGGGIAAPSANRFGAVSPTTAEHVRAEFGAEVPLVLDGGPCAVGIESTVLDLSSGTPILLRPGAVTREELETFTHGDVPLMQGGSVASPGQMASHYAPRARVLLVSAHEADEREAGLRREGKKVALLSRHAAAGDNAALARSLYAALRAADADGADVLLAVLPETSGIGLAIADRLTKAAAPRASSSHQ